VKEVYRILRPGGVVEVSEDGQCTPPKKAATRFNKIVDILFPLLPRWFTTPLRVRTRRTMSIHYPDGSQQPTDSSPLTSNGVPPHDHALLESLYLSIFESRFINLRPTGRDFCHKSQAKPDIVIFPPAVLPVYFTTYFRHVTLGPIVTFPMPPLPPIQQPCQQATTTTPAVIPIALDASETRTTNTVDAASPPKFPISSFSDACTSGTESMSDSYYSCIVSGSLL
jgi:hypothetical protein